MWFVDTFIVGDELRERVELLTERVEADRLLFEQGWARVVEQFELGVEAEVHRPRPPDDGGGRAIVVGSPAFVLAHARCTHDEFGFVAPDARIMRRWQRGASWRDDLTLGLWDEGWSVVSIDRLTVPLPDSVVEFAVGSARRTPPQGSPSGGAAG